MFARRRCAPVLLVVVGALAIAGCVSAPEPPPPPTPPPVPAGTTGPAPLASASKAVAYARAQVGHATYCYAGIGPDCFDCSGLTSMAWKYAGLTTIPRTSGDQFRKYPQVGLDALQPGDLLFPAQPNDHVMIYVGNGHVIHASSSKNAVVKILVSSYPIVYAVRPR